MCNSQCPFDDGLVQERDYINEEEAHYHWTLKEFQELIRIHGARKVFGDLETNFIIKVTKELSSENN